MKTFCSVLLLCVVACFGQGVTGSISGSVQDSTGALIPNASVAAVNMSTGERRNATTDASGSYTFPALPIGRYRLEATAPGFKSFAVENIVLDVNQAARVDAKLDVGNVSDQITVTADSALVDTQQVQVGGVVDTQRVNDLPLNGRNVYDLVSTLPGVVRTNFATVQSNEGNFLNVNGSRSRHSTFMLDGGFNNDLYRNTGNAAPNPDAVEQFRLITSNFNAEFGRSPGAVFNVVTKSGTNDFRGSLWEFLRNDNLNARNFFQANVNSLRQNQFGAAVGGPIARNRTFFFGSYQGLRIRQGVFINGGLPPTALERAGDFSVAPAAQRPVDPLTRQPFPGGIIPADRMDPVARKILEMSVPLPNTPDGRLEASASQANDEDQVVAKIDHQLTENHKLYGTFFLLQGRGTDPFAAGTQVPAYANNVTALRQRNVVANEDWIVSPTTLNQARFSYSRRYSMSETLNRTSWAQYGSRVTFGSQPERPPQLFINGRWQMGIFSESTFPQETFGFYDTLSATRGSHNLKGGAQILFNRSLEAGNWLGAGQVRFNGSFTGNTLADFLLGQAASFRQNNGQNRDFRSQNYYLFLQDDWRITRKLTLNLGIRYELNTPTISVQNELTGFEFNRQSQVIPAAPLGLIFPGDPGVPRGIAPVDKNNFAPRIGLALDVFGDGRSAIRAGYGVFYAIGFGNMTSNLQGQPYLVDVTVFGTPNLVNPYANIPGGSPFPYTFDAANPRFSLPISANFQDGHMRTPYVQHYSLTWEQRLLPTLSLQAGYVGNTSRKLLYQRDANAPIYIPGQSTAANINARRPYLPGTFAQIAHTSAGSNAHYDSLQMTLNKRFSHGFTIVASYTLSKSIDEMSDDVFSPTSVSIVDSNNRAIERGPSDTDTRHVFVTNWLYEVPAIARFGWFGRHVLGGWQANGILRADSGNALTITSGRDSNLDGNTNDRPNRIGQGALPGDRPRAEKILRYFDTGAFQVPATGAVGNSGRGILYGPGSWNLNAGAFKRIRLTERHNLQFRAELFNALNHTNLGNPNLAMNSPNFGRILSAGQPRIVQFGLKYLF